MEVVLNNWEPIFITISVVLSIVAPAWGAQFIKSRGVVQALVKVIQQSPGKNSAAAHRARSLGNKKAAALIERDG